MRRVGLALAVALAVAGGAAAVAQQSAPGQTVEQAELAWQAVITGQIEAFRSGDAPGAFQYAGAAFQTGFPSAEAFFITIIASGYSPIAASRSHSFGRWERIGEGMVLQTVRLAGADQSLYEAIYQLGEEPSGWRVLGVRLVKLPAISV